MEEFMNVAFSSDNNYVKQLEISMISLFENNKDMNISVYIIDNGINNENKERLNNIVNNYNNTIKYYSFDKLTEGLKTDNSFPVSSFGRIFLPIIKEIDKIIYFDCDSIIADSINSLYNIDISDYYLAGVQDTVYNFYKELIGLNKEYRYVNARNDAFKFKKNERR